MRGRGAFTEMARVGTHENLWADLLSREGGLAVFLEQVEGLGLVARRLDVAAGWRDTGGLRSCVGDPELR